MIKFQKSVIIILFVIAIGAFASYRFVHSFDVVLSVEQGILKLDGDAVAEVQSVHHEPSAWIDTVVNNLRSRADARPWHDLAEKVFGRFDRTAWIRVAEDSPADFLAKLSWSAAGGGFEHIEWQIEGRPPYRMQSNTWHSLAKHDKVLEETVIADSNGKKPLHAEVARDAAARRAKAAREKLKAAQAGKFARLSSTLHILMTDKQIWLHPGSPARPKAAESFCLVTQLDSLDEAIQFMQAEFRRLGRSADLIRIHAGTNVSAGRLLDICTRMDHYLRDSTIRDLSVDVARFLDIDDSLRFCGKSVVQTKEVEGRSRRMMIDELGEAADERCVFDIDRDTQSGISFDGVGYVRPANDISYFVLSKSLTTMNRCGMPDLRIIHETSLIPVVVWSSVLQTDYYRGDDAIQVHVEVRADGTLRVLERKDRKENLGGQLAPINGKQDLDGLLRILTGLPERPPYIFVFSNDAANANSIAEVMDTVYRAGYRVGLGHIVPVEIRG